MTLNVRKQNEFQLMLDDAEGKLVIVDFYAKWCMPSKMIAPMLEQLARDYEKHLVILKVDVDENEDLAEEYGVTSMPTFVFIKSGNRLETLADTTFENVRATALRGIK